MLGHKTGSSGTTPSGFTAVHNDVGIMQLPNGNKVIIVVFIKDSREKPEKNDEIMARIAKVDFVFGSTK